MESSWWEGCAKNGVADDVDRGQVVEVNRSRGAITMVLLILID